MIDELKIVPAEIVGKDWFWHRYDDGSGHLESPDGKKYMLYDLCTHEYQETINSRYEFFPLKYYYVDGYNKEEFNPFEFMEREMIDILKNRK